MSPIHSDDGHTERENGLVIRKGTPEDIDSLMAIFDEARGTIKSLGIDQWQDGYPQRFVIENDIANGNNRVIEENGKVCGTFALFDNGEVTYDEIFDGDWLTGFSKQDYTAVHRVTISVANRGSGLSGRMIEYCLKHASENGKKSLRIDTHEGNKVMRRMLEKNGFVHCGTIYLLSGAKRVAYERRTEE